MPLPIIANVFRATLNWQNAGNLRAHNVLHFQDTGGGHTSTDVYNAIDAHVTQAMWDWTAGAMVVDSVDVIALDGSGASTTFLTGGPAKWTGGGLGSPIPAVCGIVKFQTGFRGPRNRGRIFIPMVGEGETADGLLIDVAAVGTAWGNFRTAMAAASYPLQVASYTHATAKSVTSVVPEGLCATQRRRQQRAF